MPLLRSLFAALVVPIGALGVVLVIPSACVALRMPPAAPSPAESLLARSVLQEVVTEYWRDGLSRRLDLALVNGLPVTGLPDFSEERRKADLRLSQRISRGIERINPAALTQDEYITTLALQWEMDAQAEASAFVWGDFSILSPATTPIRDLTDVYRLHPMASPADAEQYLFFVRAFPFILERIRTGLEARRERGYVPPRQMVEAALTFYRRLGALGTEGPWRLPPERMSALDSVDQRALRHEIEQVATLRIVPAIDSMVAFLAGPYLAEAAPLPGLWQYPGGKELYRYLLRRHSSLDIAPDEAHQVGLGELRRIDSTMTALRTQQRWNPDAVAFHDSLRLATSVSPTLGATIARVKAGQVRLAAALDSRFPRAPALEPIVREVTPAEAALWPDGVYLPSTPVDSAGTLLLTERWRQPAAGISLASRAFRLLVPGRHLEAALRRGNPAIPATRRLIETPGFTDGWGQYAASLAGEMGMYNDPVDAYGRLLDEGSATALLVVDTGIHYLGWSLPQARLVLGRYLLATEPEIDSTLIEQVVIQPGRAGAGALGAREVAAMRAWMQGQLGRDFSQRDWHGEMLSLGSLPLPIVGTHLEWWLYDVTRRADEAAKAAAKAAEDSAAARRRRPAQDTTTTRKRDPSPGD